MGRLSGFKYREVARRFSLFGFSVIRRAGSHETWRHPDGRSVVLVRHVNDYPEGTLRSNLRDANVPVDRFLSAR